MKILLILTYATLGFSPSSHAAYCWFKCNYQSAIGSPIESREITTKYATIDAGFQSAIKQCGSGKIFFELLRAEDGTTPATAADACGYSYDQLNDLIAKKACGNSLKYSSF